jgi:hypothetical protein
MHAVEPILADAGAGAAADRLEIHPEMPISRVDPRKKGLIRASFLAVELPGLVIFRLLLWVVGDAREVYLRIANSTECGPY